MLSSSHIIDIVYVCQFDFDGTFPLKGTSMFDLRDTVSINVHYTVCACQREGTRQKYSMFHVWGSGGSGLSLIRADTQDGKGTHSPRLSLLI